ncbi:MAG TPA: polysaccharide deacetylase family protein [Micromonosporaceae bacterium]|nr:polysaccharide deacetylase family protein [Micromonosporaceae bacterium]
MPRRAAVAAITTGLAVLALLAGAHWMIKPSPAPAAKWRSESPATTPPPASASAVTPTITVPPAQAASTPTLASSAPSATTPAAPAPTPSGPAVQPLDLMRRTSDKGVALTFDDGPHPVWTPQILDALRAAKVSATFCVVGSQAERHPELIARIVREGHTLCNHTWRHEFDLGTRPEAEIRANLERTNRAIRRGAPDAPIKYFRHPGGKWTPAAVDVAHDLGMRALHWDVDPQDWAQPGAGVITKRVLDRARSGSIVLLHDGGGDRSGTLQACSGLLSTLKQKFGIVLLK